MTESSNGCVSTLLETCLPETVNRDEKEIMPSRQFFFSSAAGTLHFQTSQQACRSQAPKIKAQSSKRAQPICFDSHTSRLGAYPL